MKLRLLLLLPMAFTAAAGEETATHRVTGLFSPQREADLRTSVTKIPGLTLVSVDMGNASAVFRYDPAVAFKGTPNDPKHILERLNHELRNASHSTFGAAPLIATPVDKLTRVEISAGGCDCKACAFAAYQSLAPIEGVAAATVDFKAGRISVLVDPAKTNRAALEDALKKRGVEVKPL